MTRKRCIQGGWVRSRCIHSRCSHRRWCGKSEPAGSTSTVRTRRQMQPHHRRCHSHMARRCTTNSTQAPASPPAGFNPAVSARQRPMIGLASRAVTSAPRDQYRRRPYRTPSPPLTIVGRFGNTRCHELHRRHRIRSGIPAPPLRRHGSPRHMRHRHRRRQRWIHCFRHRRHRHRRRHRRRHRLRHRRHRHRRRHRRRHRLHGPRSISGWAATANLASPQYLPVKAPATPWADSQRVRRILLHGVATR